MIIVNPLATENGNLEANIIQLSNVFNHSKVWNLCIDMISIFGTLYMHGVSYKSYTIILHFVSIILLFGIKGKPIDDVAYVRRHLIAWTVW